MKEKDESKNTSESGSTEQIKKVRELSQKSKAAALGLAVVLTLSVGVVSYNLYNDDDDDSYYVDIGGFHGGGSYYYSPGSTYKSGSWSKSSSTIGSSSSSSGHVSSSGRTSSNGYSGSSHSASRGASIGG